MSERVSGEAEVAYKLFELVMHAEGKIKNQIATGVPNLKEDVTREYIIQAYSECLNAVQRPRSRATK